MLNWKKQGKIFDPKLISGTNSHSQVPFGIMIDQVFRIYFTSRPPKDKDGTYVSYIYFADFDPNDLTKILHVNKDPLLKLGELGSFDEFGTMPCSIIKRNDELWMYYVGWTRMVSVPYNCANGLAISKDNGKSFVKYSEGPIMGRSIDNPYIIGCPRVYNFNNKYFMWFIAGTGWLTGATINEPAYKIKMAISEDGLNWNTIQNDVVTPIYDNECQTSVSVFFHNNLYHMYFTYRYATDFRNSERGYRIGYAFSSDLKIWQRDDINGGITVSNNGWDSEMICYPFITSINDKIIMLYCGNSFGVDGFGFAELIK